MIDFHKNGFFILPQLDWVEFDFIVQSVEKKYREVLANFLSDEEALTIQQYSQISHQLDHSKIWTKTARCLDRSAVNQIENQCWVRGLKKEIGEFHISDEESLGHGNIYFRLVRQNENGDVGPLHADAWFWEIAQKETRMRLKVWLPLVTSGEMPFLYIPGSHLSNKYNYKIVERHGSHKPDIVEQPDPSEVHRFGQDCGVPIVFHDKLIHGGAVSRKGTRVSIEFTMVMENGNL